MKTLKKMLAPLAIAIVGSIGAFATTSMASASKPLVNQQGYRFVSAADPCHLDLMCRTEPGPVCTSETNPSLQIWGKANPSINVCEVRLNKIPN